jgi:ATP-binding cassette subfamily C protein LapB
MDDGNEARMINLLKNEIKEDDTLVLVTHKPSLLGIVDRIIVMTQQGIAMDGSRDEILKKLSVPQGIQR